MPIRALAGWKLALAYAGFAVFAFFVFFYLTFPYGAVRERIVAEAAAQGYRVEMRGLGPGLFGVTARGLTLQSASAATAPPIETGGEAPASEPLRIDSLALRPSLFPIGLAFRARLLDGTISGAIGSVGDLEIRASASGLELNSPNLKAFTGMDLAGTLEGELSLDVPKVAPTGPNARGAAQPDFGQANGSMTLDGEQLAVNGGTVTVPMYGTPTPMDLPKIAFGNLDGKITFEKGVGTLETFTAKSDDLDLQGSGTVKLARRVEFSELNLELRLKLEQEFQKRLGMVAAGLTMLQPDRKDPQFRVAKVTGFLGRPSFR